jgi:hypothetical protein
VHHRFAPYIHAQTLPPEKSTLLLNSVRTQQRAVCRPTKAGFLAVFLFVYGFSDFM